MVLFDMDGLLLDTERVCLECCVAIGQRYDLPDLSEVFMQMIGLRGVESAEILNRSLLGQVSSEQFVSEWDVMIDGRFAQGVEVKAGAVALLERLKARDIRVAVATSTLTDTARKHLEKAALLGFFDEVVGGDMVTHGKPHPEIYQKAAAALNVSPTNCNVFEDSDPGVRAGIAAGAQVVQVPDIKPPSAELIAMGHIIAPDLLMGARRVGLI